MLSSECSAARHSSSVLIISNNCKCIAAEHSESSIAQCRQTCELSTTIFTESLFGRLNQDVFDDIQPFLTLLYLACFSTSSNAPKATVMEAGKLISLGSLPLRPAMAACKLCSNSQCQTACLTHAAPRPSVAKTDGCCYYAILGVTLC